MSLLVILTSCKSCNLGLDSDQERNLSAMNAGEHTRTACRRAWSIGGAAVAKPSGIVSLTLSSRSIALCEVRAAVQGPFVGMAMGASIKRARRLDSQRSTRKQAPAANSCETALYAASEKPKSRHTSTSQLRKDDAVAESLRISSTVKVMVGLPSQPGTPAYQCSGQRCRTPGPLPQ